MKLPMGFLFINFVIICLYSCVNSSYIKESSPDFTAFKAFVFLNGKDGENGSYTGEAAFRKNGTFKMKAYDNLLGQEVFDFSTLSEGWNSVCVPSEQTVYRINDSGFYRVMTGYFYMIFSSNMSPDRMLQNGVSNFTIESNRLVHITVPEDGAVSEITVLTKFGDLSPKRVKINYGDGTILFDIISYSRNDFVLNENGYNVKEVGKSSLFDWIGEINGE